MVVSYLVIALITSILSALTSGLEAMFIALNVYDLSRLNISNKKYKRIEFIIMNKKVFIFIFLLLNTLWNVIFSISIFFVFLNLNFSEVVSLVLSVMVITPFLFIFSEVLPKAVFRKYKDRIIISIYPIFLPLAFLGKLFFRKQKTDFLSLENIITVIQEEFEEGGYFFISEMLKNISNLEEISVKDVMVPINMVRVVSLNSKVKDIVGEFDNDFILVVDGINPVGFVKLENVFLELINDKSDTLVSEVLVRPKVVVYEKLKFISILERNVDFREPIFVVNDMGVVIGVISSNRIFETIKKSISEVRKKTITSRSFVVDGNVSIFEVMDMVGRNYSNLEKEYTWLSNVNTVSGIIMFLNGFLPQVGQKIKFSDMVFQVLEISNFRISKVKVIF